MARKLATLVVMLALLLAVPAMSAYAQSAPTGSHTEQSVQAKNDNKGKNGNDNNSRGKQAPQPTVYSRQAASTLISAFDRAMGEIDGVPAAPTSQEVKAMTFRRRLLELRLLMDTNSFAYNHDQMKANRDIVDAAYEATGEYQDISVIEKSLGVDVQSDIEQARLNQMNDMLAPLRDQGTRDSMRAFFSDPRPTVRSSPGSPRLWDEAQTRASDNLDMVGNAALLEAGLLRDLASNDLGVNDIHNADQAAQFHAVRKQIRSVLVLASLFPETNDALQDVYKNLDDFNDDYDDTHDAYNAWVTAQQIGIDPGPSLDKLNKEFDKAQQTKNELIDSNALWIAASHLDGVRDAHRT